MSDFQKAVFYTVKNYTVHYYKIQDKNLYAMYINNHGKMSVILNVQMICGKSGKSY